MRHYLVVRHKVKDYVEWRREFDRSYEGLARTYGLKRTWINRSVDDRNELVIVSELNDVARGREFIGCPELKQAMDRGGVIDSPAVWFLDELAEVGEPVGAVAGRAEESEPFPFPGEEW